MTNALPDGFRYLPRWADAAVSDLAAQLTWEQPSIRMFGREVQIPRLTCWMGEGSYTYSGHTNIPVEPPPVVADLLAKLHAFTGARFNSVLANYYRSGADSVAWHSDDEPELGDEPVIASLSFGAARDFQIKSKATGERTTITLGHGDLLIMSGRSQAEYLHAVPKTARKVGERINLTFRLTR